MRLASKREKVSEEASLVFEKLKRMKNIKVIRDNETGTAIVEGTLVEDGKEWVEQLSGFVTLYVRRRKQRASDKRE